MNTFREILRDHLRYSRHIFKLAKSDLIRTYRGASLGWAWAVIRPAVTILVYYVSISLGLRGGKPVGEYTYFLWLIAGGSAPLVAFELHGDTELYEISEEFALHVRFADRSGEVEIQRAVI